MFHLLLGQDTRLGAIGSLPPVVRAAVLVGDSNKISVVLPDAIDDAVRKTGNDPLAQATGKRRACLGAGGNTLRGLLKRGKKTETESVEARPERVNKNETLAIRVYCPTSRLNPPAFVAC